MNTRAVFAIPVLVLALAAAHAAEQAFSVAGKWDTDFGPMELAENGDAVTGSYALEGGKILGTRSANQLTAYWTQNKSTRKCEKAVNGSHFYGRIVFDFTANAFVGKWGYCEDMPADTWSGKRGADSASKPNAGPSAPWVARSFTGPYLPLAGAADFWSNPKAFKSATVQSRFTGQKGTTCHFDVQFNNAGAKPIDETVMIGRPGKVAWSQYDIPIRIKLNPGTNHAFRTEVRECPLHWGETKDMVKCSSCEPVVYFSAP